MRDRFRPAVAAVTFLSVIPIGRGAQIRPRDLRRSLVFFPVVGGLIGAVTATAAWGAAIVLPSHPAAVLGVAAGVLVTGAIHLDGLADTADGLGAALGGKDTAAVMHDPRLGTFGGAALTLDLLLKVSVLSALVVGPRFPVEVIAAGVIGRAIPIALVAALPYAGTASGAGAWARGTGLGASLGGITMASALGILTVGPAFGAMIVPAVIIAVIVGRWSSRHLGGVTGDTLGAAAELTETLSLTASLAFR